MYNLMSNAVKFTPEGGKVSVTAQTCNSSGVEISVSDTGIGICPEDLERIFSPFEQVETSKSRKYQGTGLGLSLTKRLG
jgi:signal transduction histidine kinase